MLIWLYVYHQTRHHDSLSHIFPTFNTQIYDGPGAGDPEDGMTSAARAVRRRRPIQIVEQPPAASNVVEAGMGLSTYQADVLFDFFVEHSVNGNPQQRQKVLNLLEEKFLAADEMQKRQRIS